MPKNRTAIGATLLIAVLLVALYSALQPPAATSSPRAAPQVAATAPFSIDPAMLDTIQRLPADLTATITANTHSRTEIVAAVHTFMIPLEPFATPIGEIWCISLYPSATMTLYVQRYVAPKDDPDITAGDYVPGKSGSGSIDHFLAAKRGGVWELYHPEVYPWEKLGC